MFRSIKNKLIFLFLIAVLTPLLVMRLIAYPSAQKVIQETTISNLQSIGSKKVSQVNDWLDKLKITAERIANNPLVAEAVNLTKADADTVSKFLSHIPYDALFHRFMISDVSGNIKISEDDKLVGLNISDIQGFACALDGKTYISDIASSAFYESGEFRFGYHQAMLVDYIGVITISMYLLHLIIQNRQICLKYHHTYHMTIFIICRHKDIHGR